jgi:AcrR family transcriptional regulator
MKEFKPRPKVQERIEEAAMHLIATSNSTDLTFGDIANAAHCSLQTLYNYYDTIENLWIACGARVLKSLSVRLMDHLQGLESPKERCRKSFWLMLDFFERHEQSVTLFMSTVHFQTWMQHESFHQPEVNKVLLDLIVEGQKSGELTTAVSKIAILDYIYGVLFRFIQMREIRGDKLSNAERANVLFEMVWRGISNPEYSLSNA